MIRDRATVILALVTLAVFVAVVAVSAYLPSGEFSGHVYIGPTR